MRTQGTTVLVLALAVVLLATLHTPAQVPPDQAAAMLLDSGRRAYNEKNHAFAATRFREFLTKFAGHREAPAARYGLALCLLEGPERDYKTAAEQLQQIAGNREMPEYPFV